MMTVWYDENARKKAENQHAALTHHVTRRKSSLIDERCLASSDQQVNEERIPATRDDCRPGRLLERRYWL